MPEHCTPAGDLLQLPVEPPVQGVRLHSKFEMMDSPPDSRVQSPRVSAPQSVPSASATISSASAAQEMEGVECTPQEGLLELPPMLAEEMIELLKPP